MRLTSLVAVTLSVGFLSVQQSHATPTVGQPAPDFKVTDATGKVQKLSEHKGKYVVLEWFNFACPFTQKHYRTSNMQNLQRKYSEKGVIWYSVLSSAPGKEGYSTPEEAIRQMSENKGVPTAILPDPDGKIGRLFEAKTTPHLFVINPQGVLIYKGAIDNNPSADPGDVAGARNYVSQALDEAMAGKPVSTPATKSYGCSVKY